MRKFNFKVYFRTLSIIMVMFVLLFTLIYGFDTVNDKVCTGETRQTSAVISGNSDDYMVYFDFFGEKASIKMHLTEFLFSKTGLFQTVSNAEITLLYQGFRLIVSLIV